MLDWVESGEEILITRRGKPVARLVPDTPRHDTQQAQAAARIRARARTLKRGAFDWEEWKVAHGGQARAHYGAVS